MTHGVGNEVTLALVESADHAGLSHAAMKVPCSLWWAHYVWADQLDMTSDCFPWGDIPNGWGWGPRKAYEA